MNSLTSNKNSNFTANGTKNFKINLTLEVQSNGVSPKGTFEHS